MLKITVFLVALALASASLEADWAIFKYKYQRVYDEREDLRRRDIYEATMKEVREHNELYSRGLSSYYMGENQFSDWTAEELRLPMTNFDIKTDSKNTQETQKLQMDVSKVPKTVDWRKKGYVTPVQDVAKCRGGSFVFAAVAALEGLHFKAKKELVKLSESQVIDCYSGFFNNCENGMVTDVYDYIMKAGGVEAANSYPYVDRVCNCTFQKDKVVATLNGYARTESRNETALQIATAEIGPIAANIIALMSLRNYRGGVYDDATCFGSFTSHSVTIVGYGTEKGKDYWLVKNSWGVGWGEGGYVKMVRNSYDQCNIAKSTSYPTL